MSAPVTANRDRAWWPREARQRGTDWHATVPLWWLEFIPCPHCGLAPCDELIPEPAAEPKPSRRAASPTPQCTIEAVMHGVRQRGVVALKEPANRERLSRCDAAAKAQIDSRIAKLIAPKAGAT